MKSEKMRTKLKTLAALVAGVHFALSAHAAGSRQYSAYRSFTPSPEMTGRFARQGVTVRGFGVCNTFCGNGKRLYSDPITWKGVGQYDWTGVDGVVSNLLTESPSAKFIALVDLNTPSWMAKRADGDSFNTIGTWATNAAWRATTKVWLAECLRHLESKYGDRMLAYLLMAGQTTEWFQYYTPPAALGMKSAAFENQIYDPTSEKAKIDHWREHNRGIADALLDFAHAAKRQIPASREVGAFFGYYNVCNGDWFASGGHLDYGRVAASPDIDFFASPTTYAEREMGGGAGTMVVNGTLRRHGKRVIHEIDCRTSAFDSPLGGICQWKTPDEDVAGLTRETAFALINGCSWWWFDLFTTNNFSGAKVQACIRRLQTLRNRFADANLETAADVLMVCDPETALNCVEGGKMRFCGDRFRNKLNRTGLMYDVCSFDDLDCLDLAKYRLVCLPATWVITPKRAALLKEKVCGGGRTVLWSYAPGVSDGVSLDVSRVATWAGVKYGAHGILTTRRDAWTSVYRHDPAKFTIAELRSVGLAAGCHAWTDEPLPVAANARLVAVHAATAGMRTIHFKSKADEVVDAMTGTVVARGVDAVTLPFAAPETKVLELKSAAAKVVAAEPQRLELGMLFQDHAVVQRDKRVAVWGKGAKPFSRIEATLGKVKGATRAASDGSFMFRLAPQPAGGPYVLSVKDESGRAAAASDIYVGEVWLAVGQEEMELRMRSCEPGADPGDHPLVRQFTVSVEGAFRPLAEPRGAWAVATEGEIPDFCGIGYFFAQELQRKSPGVAVGIIQSALGGTSILSWSSRSCLMGVPGAVREVEQYEKDAEDVRVWNAKPQPMADFGPAEAEARGWARADFDDAGWRKVKLPNEDLDCGVFGRSFHGAAWFRRRVTLPKRWEGRDLVMLGGRIDKQDRAYLGGECVGASGKGFEQLFWNVLRRYRIPAAKVKAGETVVAIRVWSHQLGFGVHGKPEELCLAPADDPKDVLPLAGEWRVAIERDIGDVQYARTTLPGNPCAPHALYDAAIAPLVPYSLRGFLWYQGYVEINMGRIGLYRALQTAMVRDWRRAWGDGDLPFILMSLDGSGVEASMLKAQTGTAEDLAKVGVISTVGTRVAGDDEKRNMREIGRRACAWALTHDKEKR